MENRDRKTAIIAGATGLVGAQLLDQLLSEPAYAKVVAVVRKPLELHHEKLEQLVIDFALLPAAIKDLKGDHGYCCLGTTLKAAGSKERQYIIDHDYVMAFAEGCRNIGVNRLAVVSSIGASAGSNNFYLRTKGIMERDLRMIQFPGLYIFQPSFLLGDRKEFRAGEKTAIAVMKVLNPLLISRLKKYRGVRASSVAKCMISQVLFGTTGVKIIRSDEIN